LQQLGCFLDIRDGAHFPRTAMRGKADQVPASRGRDEKYAFYYRLDIKAPSTKSIACWRYF
jgi:hypothetical protein